MATLTSASTDAAVKDAYDDNASYEEDNSVAKAKIFITACRILIRRLPKMARRGPNAFELSKQDLQDEMNEARAFVKANDTSANAARRRVTHGNFDNFRD